MGHLLRSMLLGHSELHATYSTLEDEEDRVKEEDDDEELYEAQKIPIKGKPVTQEEEPIPREPEPEEPLLYCFIIQEVEELKSSIVRNTRVMGDLPSIH